MPLPFHNETSTVPSIYVFKTSLKLSVHGKMKILSLNTMKEQTALKDSSESNCSFEGITITI